MGLMYSYDLYVLESSKPYQDEATGNFINGSEQWVFVSKCRDEVNGGGKKVTTTDGGVYVFGAVVYMPKNTPIVNLGAKIKVVDEEGNVRLEGNNTLCKREKFHTRLWV